MKNNVMYALVFAVGAAIGSVVTWKVVKDYYKSAADEEIESVKAAYAPVTEALEDCDAADISESGTYNRKFEKPDLQAYAATIKQNGYGEEMKNVKRPYVIPPEEFDECPGYDTFSYTYYADGVLTDENDEVVVDVDDVVGEDFADHFGEYEEDSVFIRNDDMEADIEILKDERDYYGDIVNSNPHSAEGK